MGSAFLLIATLYRSAKLSVIFSRNRSKSDGLTTRVFPNQRRSGAIRPGGRRDFGIAGAIAHHELAADHLALLVADGLAVVVHFEAGDGGGGAGVGGGGDEM
eukprot:scaffold15650_cov40-Cyclotella_meneghiniana.AAC.1